MSPLISRFGERLPRAQLARGDQVCDRRLGVSRLYLRPELPWVPSGPHRTPAASVPTRFQRPHRTGDLAPSQITGRCPRGELSTVIEFRALTAMRGALATGRPPLPSLQERLQQTLRSAPSCGRSCRTAPAPPGLVGAGPRRRARSPAIAPRLGRARGAGRPRQR